MRELIDKFQLYNNAKIMRAALGSEKDVVVACSEFLELINKAPAIKVGSKKKYVIQKAGYAETVVSLTEGEATAISNFINWACLEDDFAVEEVENYSAEEWGTEYNGRLD